MMLTFITGYALYILMKKRPLTPATRLEIEGMEGYFIRTVTRFGNSAKIDCPKEYLGKTVYVIVT